MPELHAFLDTGGIGGAEEAAPQERLPTWPGLAKRCVIGPPGGTAADEGSSSDHDDSTMDDTASIGSWLVDGERQSGANGVVETTLPGDAVAGLTQTVDPSSGESPSGRQRGPQEPTTVTPESPQPRPPAEELATNATVHGAALASPTCAADAAPEYNGNCMEPDPIRQDLIGPTGRVLATNGDPLILDTRCSCEGCMSKPCGTCISCRAAKRCVHGRCKNQKIQSNLQHQHSAFADASPGPSVSFESPDGHQLGLQQQQQQATVTPESTLGAVPVAASASLPTVPFMEEAKRFQDSDMAVCHHLHQNKRQKNGADRKEVEDLQQPHQQQRQQPSRNNNNYQQQQQLDQRQQQFSLTGNNSMTNERHQQAAIAQPGESGPSPQQQLVEMGQQLQLFQSFQEQYALLLRQRQGSMDGYSRGAAGASGGVVGGGGAVTDGRMNNQTPAEQQQGQLYPSAAAQRAAAVYGHLNQVQQPPHSGATHMPQSQQQGGMVPASVGRDAASDSFESPNKHQQGLQQPATATPDNSRRRAFSGQHFECHHPPHSKRQKNDDDGRLVEDLRLDNGMVIQVEEIDRDTSFLLGVGRGYNPNRDRINASIPMLIWFALKKAGKKHDVDAVQRALQEGLFPAISPPMNTPMVFLEKVSEEDINFEIGLFGDRFTQYFFKKNNSNKYRMFFKLAPFEGTLVHVLHRLRGELEHWPSYARPDPQWTAYGNVLDAATVSLSEPEEPWIRAALQGARRALLHRIKKDIEDSRNGRLRGGGSRGAGGGGGGGGGCDGTDGGPDDSPGGGGGPNLSNTHSLHHQTASTTTPLFIKDEVSSTMSTTMKRHRHRRHSTLTTSSMDNCSTTSSISETADDASLDYKHFHAAVKEIRDADVYCGRDKKTQAHPGNRLYRSFLLTHYAQFQSAKLREERTSITSKIINMVHAAGGRFIRLNQADGKWYQVDNAYAHDKVRFDLQLDPKKRRVPKKSKALKEIKPTELEEEYFQGLSGGLGGLGAAHFSPDNNSSDSDDEGNGDKNDGPASGAELRATPLWNDSSSSAMSDDECQCNLCQLYYSYAADTIQTCKTAKARSESQTNPLTLLHSNDAKPEPERRGGNLSGMQKPADKGAGSDEVSAVQTHNYSGARGAQQPKEGGLAPRELEQECEPRDGSPSQSLKGVLQELSIREEGEKAIVLEHECERHGGTQDVLVTKRCGGELDDPLRTQKPPGEQRKANKKRAKTFPEKLMQAMMEYGDEDAVKWLPDGKSFVIVSRDIFVREVLNKVFKQAKYASFIRKIHRWGFMRLTSATGADSFHHPLFQRNRKELASKITCAKDASGSASAASKSGVAGAGGASPSSSSSVGGVGAAASSLVRHHRRNLVEKFIRAEAAAVEPATGNIAYLENSSASFNDLDASGTPRDLSLSNMPQQEKRSEYCTSSEPHDW